MQLFHERVAGKEAFKYTRQPRKTLWVVQRSRFLDFMISKKSEKRQLLLDTLISFQECRVKFCPFFFDNLLQTAERFLTALAHKLHQPRYPTAHKLRFYNSKFFFESQNLAKKTKKIKSDQKKLLIGLTFIKLTLQRCNCHLQLLDKRS